MADKSTCSLMSNYYNSSLPYRSTWQGFGSVNHHARDFNYPQQPFENVVDPERKLYQPTTPADKRVDVSRSKEGIDTSVFERNYRYSSARPMSAPSSNLKLPGHSDRMQERDSRSEYQHHNPYFPSGPLMVQAGMSSVSAQAFTATPSEEERDVSSVRAEEDDEDEEEIIEGEDEQDLSSMTPAERLAAKRKMKRFRYVLKTKVEGQEVSNAGSLKLRC